MITQTITLNLPVTIYKRLQQMAQAMQQPLETVVFQTIQGNLPPLVEDLPAPWQSELLGLSHLSDEQLGQIAKETLPAKQWRRHQRLLEKNQAADLTEIEQQELAHLRGMVDRFVMRHSFALAMLKWRGYNLPIS